MPEQIQRSHKVALTGLIRPWDSTPDFRLGFLKGMRLRRLGSAFLLSLLCLAGSKKQLALGF